MSHLLHTIEHGCKHPYNYVVYIHACILFGVDVWMCYVINLKSYENWYNNIVTAVKEQRQNETRYCMYYKHTKCYKLLSISISLTVVGLLLWCTGGHKETSEHNTLVSINTSQEVNKLRTPIAEGVTYAHACNWDVKNSRSVLISEDAMYRLQWSCDLKMCPY